MLEIFPTQVLDNSIHTAILVGLMLSWLFTERLGWGFVGFVVPGYLAAVGIVQPLSLAATVVEAIVTYGVVWALGNGAPYLRLWAPVFGRERFLLFILVSVPVRLLVEGGLAGQIQPILWALSDSPDWKGGQFFSIGIVLVPLLANIFWKPGLAAGLWEVGVKTSLTAAVLMLVLEPLTNFDTSSFQLAFDALALDFLYMPRFTIILLVTAVMATRVSLRLGWDFSGILIPSLLAVVFFTPLKLFWTLLEILLLIIGFRLVLRLPVLRKMDISGVRQILVMYMLSYSLKLGTAHVAGAMYPDAYSLDLYGFGYLLTSLIALRCHQKGVLQVLLPVGLTSTQGFALGALVALALGLATPAIERPEPPRPAGELPSLDVDIVRSWSSVRKLIPERSSAQNRTRALLTFRELTQGVPVERAVLRWYEQGLQLSWSAREDGVRCLGAREERTESVEPTGITAMWWCGGTGPVLLVPQPRTNPDSLWVAAWLAQHGQFAGVVVLGSDVGVLNRASTSTLRGLLGDRPVISVATTHGEISRLLPRASGLTLLDAVQATITPLEVDFSDIVDDPVWSSLRPTDALLMASIPAVEGRMAEPDVTVLNGDEWAAVLEQQAVSRIQNTYQAASMDTRYSRQDYLLRHILRTASVSQDEPPPRLRYMARLLGSKMHTVVLANEQKLWLLSDGDNPRGWGSWFVPLGVERGAVVLAPHSVEEPGTAGLGLGVLSALDGRALWVSGSAQEASFDEEGQSMEGFEAFSAEALGVLTAVRESGEQPTMVMVRARAHLNAAAEALVLSDGQEILTAERQNAVNAALGSLSGAPFSVSAEDRLTRDTAIRLPRLLDVLIGDRLTLMWLSRHVLSGADGHPDKEARLAWYQRMGIAINQGAMPAVEGEAVTDAVDLPLLQAHLSTGLAAPLRRCAGQLALFDDGAQLSLQSTHEGVVCQVPTLGTAGCWRAP